METKKCSKCGEVKAVSEFNKNKNRKDGLHTYCKKCVKQYYQVNKEKTLEQKKQYRQANKEKIKERKKKYYQVNKEKTLEHNKQYRQANKEKIKERKKKYYQANKEKTLEHSKQYRQANKEKIEQYNKQYRQANKEKLKEKSKDNRNKLVDPYIKTIISKQTNGMLKAKDIPQELIELKRNNIILKRKIKDNGKEATNL